MAFRLAIGESDFADLRKHGDYYVDKTEIINELVNENHNKVSLFTRPRRFGKTLMMSMLENFFSVRKDSRDLFEGLAITRHEDLCRKWMNQYPVIFLSFKDVEGLDFESAYAMLKLNLSELCIGLDPVFKGKFFDEDDEKNFFNLKSKKSDAAVVKNSLKILCRMMYSVYGKKVILLIDEYDVPIAKASERDSGGNNFYSQMLDVIRGIMSTALKDNEFLEFAVITGCLRISKESIFTGTKNFASYSVIDKKYSTYFGFSESDVETMLLKADLSDAAPVIKAWYDGYVFGHDHVYCPWDVINYISDLKYDRKSKPKNYWKNTSHNGILMSFVKQTDFDVGEKFEILLNGGTIEQTISDALTYDTLHSSEDNFWSILLMTGYITKSNPDDDGETVSLKIPNKEIASIFEDTVVNLFKETIDRSKQMSMMDAFWSADSVGAGKMLSDLLWKTISYNDYHEDYYHAFLAGTFTGIGYEVESNKENGLGRPDIILKDEDNRRAIIIEAKKSKSEEDMDKNCDEALRQIDLKLYAKGLYGYTQILCYGVAFFQKQAKVKLLRG